MKPFVKLPEALAADFAKKWRAFKHSAAAVRFTPPDDSDFIAALTRVFVGSDFVAAHCIRTPLLLAELIESGALQRKYTPDDYPAILTQALAEVRDEASLARILRQVRRREMVRIAWRDLAGWADLTQTVTELSDFADACLAQTLSRLYRWQCLTHGVPEAPDGTPQQLVILGLGKLGARELNFSSDIDLIFAYPKSGYTRGAKHRLANEDFFARLCRRLIRMIGQTTADGFVFRVDLRLRPFGENGPLAMSFDALEHYYQEQGREWERYAWIKARGVAGDRRAGARLVERLNPFVYRRYLDFSVFESLRNMKQMISLEVQRRGMQNNIKLGVGGIREVEFFGQVFQLVRGGVTPALQERGIRKVLRILAQEGLIAPAVGAELDSAYVFLRNTEHRLQEFSDQQTHRLPSEPQARSRLAMGLGLEHRRTFDALLQQHRQNVHAHFKLLLEGPDPDSGARQTRSRLHGIWQQTLAGDAARNTLADAGFARPGEVAGLLDYLRDSAATRALSSRGRRRLDRLIPRLLEEVGRTEHPLITLRRLVDLIKAIERRTSYLALLLENPAGLAHLVKLSSASSWITSFLSQHPVLLDELLDPRILYHPPGSEELRRQLKRRLDQVAAGDLEYQIEQLCIFKQVHVLRVAAADVSGGLPLMRVSDYLSEIAATVLERVVALAWEQLVSRHGTPVCRLDGNRCQTGFAVIAYGKLGGLELGYGSDLDLVFLHAGSREQTRQGSRPVDSAQFFNRLGQRIVHILTSSTRAGRVYEIDMRLRPSGSAGVLASHVDSFGDYQRRKAWIWEHQALIRARPVCGDALVRQRFDQIRRDVLARFRHPSELRAAVIKMRERMRRELLRPEKGVFDLKQDTGGIVDIEFLVQYLVLLKSHQYPQLLRWTDNVRLIQAAIETGAIDENAAHVLKHAYLIYRAAAHQLSLQEKPARVAWEKYDHLRQCVRAIWRSVFEISGN